MADSTKKRIKDAMYKLIADKGYDKASIGQVADFIGIKKASVYYYFKTKEDILLEVVRDLYQVDFNQVTSRLNDNMSRTEYQKELLSFGEALINSYFENPDLRKVYAEIDIQTTRIEALKEIAKTADEELNQFLINCLKIGINIGVFREDFDIKVNAQILYTILIGIDSAILYQLPVQPKEVWRESVLKLFQGKDYT